MFVQVLDALDRPLCANIRVILLASTVEAVVGVFFVKGMRSIVSPRRFPSAEHQVTNKGLVEKLSQNADYFDVLHIAIHLPHQMHQC